jgi:hypothetical protein
MPPLGEDAIHLVNDIVRAGGTGDARDVDAVRGEARRMPLGLLSFFRAHGVHIVACRKSVTDVEISLRGKTPRGWEGTGRTWDSVPGTFLSNPGRVVIATVAAAGGRQVTPRGPNTHGAFSLTIHESMHGFDYSTGHASLADPRFTAARAADWASLGAYERQPQQAGLEETFAESAARHYGGDGTFAGDWTHLARFWGANPLHWSEAPLLEAPEAAPDPSAPIGEARVLDDRSLVLDLRAEGPGGAIGHAALQFHKDDALYGDIYRHVFGMSPDAEGVAPRSGLFRPMR